MLLNINNLHISYGQVEAVHGVSFHVEKGELVSIIGANGAGKTSIMNALMGIIPAHSGDIFLNDENITALPAHLRARKGIRLVPERARVFPNLTVYENLLIGIYKMRKEVDLTKNLEWIYSFFPILQSRKNQAANTLSGGEQQQLSIARALISNPNILLVDEVSMGLMPKLVDTVFEVLQNINKEFGITILIVEQNALASLKISHRGYVLEAGNLVMEGTSQELMNDPGIREAYLGI
ncbi:MAG: ABC transporter ATP-binding protein [Aminobacterium sp.]|jgi:branched-chain amino acid transport system ATP-binding protein|uniref:ABC transporter ATP-binding protein n=1 Tax=unclassified Aminobacterium TaxID=2685012 RepID=UPI001BCE8A9F|nr:MULTISPECIES: ABC transporter ATP-binding protein [unclassified Aminobacterium]MDD2207270.1 ABC transporter ATP-binding protein [Aminobacterium sp.]MDD3425268.1 ABC transporter ATP-binding protein [Aminobacterium sp.]MDD3707767.1 ABC transporter ATP-binding protein [Aminobacterium sp.]MDD4229160.1 ABC transporter ATP-binding protein [Aminobacterium sp.]MDD4552025.1 ABC transporter ATP-binding protein [Aminobacterium sp.]